MSIHDLAGFVPSASETESRGFATQLASRPSAAPYGSAGTETYLCEIFGLGKFHKLGLVEEASSGRTWCLQSDEGAHMGGTNLAPAPLRIWLAGLQADVACRIHTIARERSIVLERLHVGLTQELASQGSFARGEALALIFGLDWDFEIASPASEREIADLIDAALRTSPAVAAMREAREGRFALETNGAITRLADLEPWEAPTVVDPRSRYDAVPAATGESTGQVFTLTTEGESSTELGAHASPNASNEPARFHVDARGAVDLESGLVTSVTTVPGRGNDRWEILMDPTGHVAPSPLAMFAIGSAFCYHTQLTRFVKVRHFELAESSLAQVTTYASVDPASAASAPASEILTKMFLNGSSSEDETRWLLRVAANTCFVHRAMTIEVPMTTDLTVLAN